MPERAVTVTAAELQGYINALPRYLSEIIYLTVDGGGINQPLMLDSFTGPGYLSLTGKIADGDNLKLKKGIKINNCDTMIRIKDCELSGISVQSNPLTCVSINNSRCVQFESCSFIGSSNLTDCGVGTYNGSRVMVSECSISGWNQAVMATTTAIISARDNVASGNTCGVRVWGGGIILLSGSTPDLLGGTSNIKDGGLIVKRDGTLL